MTTSSESNPSYEPGVVVQLCEAGETNSMEFEFPLPVNQPVCEDLNWESVTLKWSNSSSQTSQPIGHKVFYRSKEGRSWSQKSVPGNSTEAMINSLEAGTEYEFKVAAEYQYGLGPESLVSDTIVTQSLPLSVRISKDITLSASTSTSTADSSKIPILTLKTTKVMNDVSKKIAKEEFGKHSHKPSKVVMLMGATGTGKSTLINGMVNFILGVKYTDPFRFKLICDGDKRSQAHSQTDVITAYTLYWQEGFAVPYSLTIIDTPGFGDTRGLERDKSIATQVKELFSIKGSDGVDQIHAIGFVTQSSLVRLTPTQRYIFDSILSIFGKDIKKNIFIMATFADSSEPPVIGAIKEADIPHEDFFPFDNSALYQTSGLGHNKFTEIYWEKGYMSFVAFFKHLQIANACSLQLSREVLEERQQLEIILNSVQPKIQEGLCKIDTLHKEEIILRARDSDVAANKDFKYDVKVTKQRKVNLPTATYVTNCLICNFTCHNPCGIPNDDKKYQCAAMDGGGEANAKCRVCPGKCGWSHHCNNPYYFEIYEEVETRTSDELLKRYNVAKTDKNAIEAIISGLHDELANMSKDVYGDIRRARNCIERLSLIALKPNPMTEVEYIDLLIESEKQEKKIGFQDRVKSLLKMKNLAQLMSKMTDKEIDDEFKQKNKKKWWQFWAPS